MRLAEQVFGKGAQRQTDAVVRHRGIQRLAGSKLSMGIDRRTELGRE